MAKMGPKGSHLEAETSQECVWVRGESVVREVHITLSFSWCTLCCGPCCIFLTQHKSPSGQQSLSGPPSHWHESALLLIVLS